METEEHRVLSIRGLPDSTQKAELRQMTAELVQSGEVKVTMERTTLIFLSRLVTIFHLFFKRIDHNDAVTHQEETEKIENSHENLESDKEIENVEEGCAEADLLHLD